MYVLFAVILLLIFMACSAYLSNLKLWNGGRCAENGQPWQVVEYKNGDLYLFAGHVARRVNGVLVPGVIVRNAEAL